MKKLLIMALMLIAGASAYAQMSDVKLKSGKTITGVIIEQDPTKFIKVKDTKGNVIYLDISEVERVSESSAVAPVEFIRPKVDFSTKGFTAFLEPGLVFDLGSTGVDVYTEVRLGVGYKIAQPISVHAYGSILLGPEYRYSIRDNQGQYWGREIGLSYTNFGVDLRGCFPVSGKFLPFYNIAMGYNIPWSALAIGGISTNMGIGGKFIASKNLGLGFQIGYQRFTTTVDELYYGHKLNTNAIYLKASVSFN